MAAMLITNAEASCRDAGSNEPTSYLTAANLPDTGHSADAEQADTVQGEQARGEKRL